MTPQRKSSIPPDQGPEGAVPKVDTMDKSTENTEALPEGIGISG